MKLIIDIPEKDYLECVKRVEEIREKGYMIENLKYKIIITEGIPLEEELEKIKTEIEQCECSDEFYCNYLPPKGVYEILDKYIFELKGEK